MEGCWQNGKWMIWLFCMGEPPIWKILCNLKVVLRGLEGPHKIGHRMDGCKQCWSLINVICTSLFIVWADIIIPALSHPIVNTSLLNRGHKIKSLNFVYMVKCSAYLSIIPLIVFSLPWILGNCLMGIFCDIGWPLVRCPISMYIQHNTMQYLKLWNIPVIYWFISLA